MMVVWKKRSDECPELPRCNASCGQWWRCDGAVWMYGCCWLAIRCTSDTTHTSNTAMGNASVVRVSAAHQDEATDRLCYAQ